jgi:hypothetical protein
MAETEEDLQELLNILHNWSIKWRMKVNINKSNIIHFRRKQRDQTVYNFKLGDQDLSLVNEYKYLGFYLDEFLDFSTGAKYLSEAASRATGSMISKFKSLKNVGFTTYMKLYHSSVVPIMDYASEIWGFGKFNSCNIIQNRVLRYFLGVHKFTPTLGINGDTGWLHSRDRRQINMLRFWNRLMSMDNNRLTKKIFSWDMEQPGSSWSNNIQTILEMLDMETIFIHKSKVDLSQVEAKLRNITNEKWQQEIINKPKLRTYILFKDSYTVEPYVNSFLSRHQRSLLAQLRLGVLPLHVETGRFKNKKDPNTGQFRKYKLEERICTLCDTNVVEDEIHFVCVCTKYVIPRTKLYNEISLICDEFTNMNHNDKFIYMLKYGYKKLAQYLESAWAVRQEHMYL